MPENNIASQQLEELLEDFDMSVTISCHHPMADNG